MFKKILILLIFVTVGIVGYIIFVSRKNGVFKLPVVEKKTAVSPTLPVIDDKKYSDEAGFSFSYKDDLKITKIETKDQAVYSSLEITSKDRSGKISILVTDSQLTKIDDYFKKEKTVKKLKLADLDARQVDKDGKLMTVALDQGALFVITAEYQNAKAFWLTVSNKVLASFAFTSPQKDESVSQDSGGSSEPAVIDEGEEEIN